MSKSESRKMNESLRIRCTTEEANLIREKADAAEMTISEFMRRASLARRIVTRTDSKMITTLLQQGGLLKHLYVLMRSEMTSELSKEFSDTLIGIRQTLKNIQIETTQVGEKSKGE
ncbi:mobilization protein [Rahnella sp. BCC 1045]|uniref:plasmid mobilization protein MobA n=1 Tax=Rahnella sp. BCC 1045 TaxID=2816251 RepID=UPI001C27BF85|nr:plasmid mobilization protein MobA [Rahnella sp. BCC 1045]MBU9819691.1 mobilization protein [Rahnella sp. BCC 1045]